MCILRLQSSAVGFDRRSPSPTFFKAQGSVSGRLTLMGCASESLGCVRPVQGSFPLVFVPYHWGAPAPAPSMGLPHVFVARNGARTSKRGSGFRRGLGNEGGGAPLRDLGTAPRALFFLSLGVSQIRLIWPACLIPGKGISECSSAALVATMARLSPAIADASIGFTPPLQNPERLLLVPTAPMGVDIPFRLFGSVVRSDLEDVKPIYGRSHVYRKISVITVGCGVIRAACRAGTGGRGHVCSGVAEFPC
jgi:hypothetical protein